MATTGNREIEFLVGIGLRSGQDVLQIQNF